MKIGLIATMLLVARIIRKEAGFTKGILVIQSLDGAGVEEYFSGVYIGLR